MRLVVGFALIFLGIVASKVFTMPAWAIYVASSIGAILAVGAILEIRQSGERVRELVSFRVRTWVVLLLSAASGALLIQALGNSAIVRYPVLFACMFLISLTDRDRFYAADLRRAHR